MSERDQLKEIMGVPVKEIAYSSHPSEGVLREYIAGRLRRSGGFDVAGLHSGSLTTWHRAEVTAHLLTCPECAQLVAELRREPAPMKVFLQRLLPAPVPTFARVVMLVQSIIIVGLVGVIYFKPTPFFSTISPTASVLPSSEITKKPTEPAPPTPHPQEMMIKPPADPMVELVQSHPVTIRVSFREDTPMRELTNLLQGMNGILIWMRPEGFLVRLSEDDQLDSMIEKLLQSPYIVEASKD